VTGDGSININDIAALKQHLLKLKSLTGENFIAGDISKKSAINISNLLAVKKQMLGISSIFQGNN